MKIQYLVVVILAFIACGSCKKQESLKPVWLVSSTKVSDLHLPEEYIKPNHKHIFYYDVIFDEVVTYETIPNSYLSLTANPKEGDFIDWLLAHPMYNDWTPIGHGPGEYEKTTEKWRIIFNPEDWVELPKHAYIIMDGWKPIRVPVKSI